MKRLFSVILIFVSLSILCCACGNPNYENYSLGIDDNGFYENFQEENVKDFVFDIKVMDILEMTKDEGNFSSVDEMVEGYTNMWLQDQIPNQKDVVEDQDYVSVHVDMFINDAKIESQNDIDHYTANKNGDDLTKGLIGKKVDSEFEVTYNYPEDDPVYPGSKALLKIKVIGIAYQDPLNNNVVEDHIEDIKKVTQNVEDRNSLLDFLKMEMAVKQLSPYVQNELKKYNIEAPQECIKLEEHRLKSRLYMMGYNWNQYLKDSKKTQTDVDIECTKTANEYYTSMQLAKKYNISVTDQDLDHAYGEQKEVMTNMLGQNYLKMAALRTKVLSYLLENVNLTT